MKDHNLLARLLEMKNEVEECSAFVADEPQQGKVDCICYMNGLPCQYEKGDRKQCYYFQELKKREKKC